MSTYVANMANKISGNKIFKSGEVLMSQNDVIEQNQFANQQENRGKTIEEYKEEYKKELLKDPEKRDKTLLNNLANTIKLKIL